MFSEPVKERGKEQTRERKGKEEGRASCSQVGGRTWLREREREGGADGLMFR